MVAAQRKPRALVTERSTMALRMRGRPVKALLLAIAPFTAALAVVGLSIAPASAYVVTNTCNTGYACFYTDLNRTPTNAILNINGVQGSWSAIPNTGGVCNSNWNDCASSYWNRRTSTVYVWKDANCTGTRLAIPG